MTTKTKLTDRDDIDELAYYNGRIGVHNTY